MNVQCYTGETPTIVAVNFGYDKCLEVLVNALANVNIRSWGGYTALMKASEFGRTHICSAGYQGSDFLLLWHITCCTIKLLMKGDDENNR